MDARGKFGEHERSVRVARGDSRQQLLLFERSPTFPRTFRKNFALRKRQGFLKFGGRKISTQTNQKISVIGQEIGYRSQEVILITQMRLA